MVKNKNKKHLDMLKNIENSAGYRYMKPKKTLSENIFFEGICHTFL
jgi:hypothetical protein